MLRKLHVAGTLVKDAVGRIYRLAGFNIHPQHPRYSEWNAKESDIAWIAEKGFNCVRATLWWNEIQPSQGVINEAYFTNYIDPFLAWCEKYDVYAILGMYRYGGPPEWAMAGYPDRKSWGDDFWRNQGNAVVSREEYVKMVKYIANRYKGRAMIAGYSLFNEPHDPSMRTMSLNELGPLVMSFYNDDLVSSIRSVDPDTIVTYDAVNSGWIPELDGYTEEYNTKQKHPNIAWGRSIYDISEGYPRDGISDWDREHLKESIDGIYDKYVREFGCPFICNEMGQDFIAHPEILVWAEDLLSFMEGQLANPYEFSFFWWRYSVGLEGWAPRNPDGSDRAIVPILQEHIVEPTPIPPILETALAVGGPITLGTVLTWLALS